MINRFQNEFKQRKIDHLYHLTALSNLKSILAWGIFSLNAATDTPHKNVSWSEVQLRRRDKFLIGSLNLHDYVPFYFATHTPMQYVITHETNNSTPSLTQDQLAILKIDAREVFQLSDIVFTDGNAASQNTAFLTEPDELNKLNWSVIRNFRYCFTRELKRLKSAEVLVPRHLPKDAISGIIVYNETAQNAVKEQLNEFFEQSHSLLPCDWVNFWLCRCEINESCYF
jgi:hypothetical protein